MKNDMRLSHILYKVKNLDEAVKDFENMGFTVRYGTKKEKAFNALIWFEEGPFIELFTVSKFAKILTFLMKIFGKRAIARRFDYFIDADYGWVEYSIENERETLDIENEKLRNFGIKYSSMNGKRTNINGLKLKWKLSIPLDLNFPFLMSAYTPNPRPKHIVHKNGAKSVSKLVWGANSKNIDLIRRFTNDDRIELVEGSGFKKIEFNDWDAKLLNIKYYK